MRTPRKLTTLGAIGTIAIAVLAAIAFWKYVNGPPYVMHVKPSSDGSGVQFVQPGSYGHSTLVSPVFQVPVTLSDAYEITLTAEDVVIPEGGVEFCDTTIKPGRFIVRFGQVKFDIMGSRVVVDGVDHDWSSEADGARSTTLQ